MELGCEFDRCVIDRPLDILQGILGNAGNDATEADGDLQTLIEDKRRLVDTVESLQRQERLGRTAGTHSQQSTIAGCVVVSKKDMATWSLGPLATLDGEQAKADDIATVLRSHRVRAALRAVLKDERRRLSSAGASYGESAGENGGLYCLVKAFLSEKVAVLDDALQRL